MRQPIAEFRPVSMPSGQPTRCWSARACWASPERRRADGKGAEWRFRECLSVEPGVFQAPHVVRAVDPDGDALDVRIGAGHRARMKDDRPAAILGQMLFDLPYDAAPLLE